MAEPSGLDLSFEFFVVEFGIIRIDFELVHVRIVEHETDRLRQSD